jgi:acetyltransferase-like isoleucine patch superfamily enzyme
MSVHESAVIVEPDHVSLGRDVTIEPLAVLMGSPDGFIEVGDGCDIGVGSVLLSGARLGAGVQVGAGVKGQTLNIARRLA